MSYFTIKSHYIYALVHPDTNALYYVGKTNNPEQRFTKHLGYGALSVTRELLKEKKKPRMEILQRYEGDSATIVEWLERAWINRLLDRGYTLINSAFRNNNNVHFRDQDSTRFLVCGNDLFDCEHQAMHEMKYEQYANPKDNYYYAGRYLINGECVGYATTWGDFQREQ